MVNNNFKDENKNDPPMAVTKFTLFSFLTMDMHAISPARSKETKEEVSSHHNNIQHFVQLRANARVVEAVHQRCLANSFIANDVNHTNGPVVGNTHDWHTTAEDDRDDQCCLASNSFPNG